MKVALLVCDHVTEKLEAKHGDYPAMFATFLPDLKMESFFVCDGHFPSTYNYDAFICTGSKRSVYEETSWILELIEFTQKVAQTSKKFFGSCFGHQMIAQALGGKVERSEHGYLIGVHSFEMDTSFPWYGPISNSYNILMLCQDQVVKLPPESKVWSKAANCPIGMISVRDQFLGIQGHPEFTKEYNRDVYQSRPEKISAEKREAANESLDEHLDTQLFREIVMGFLSS